MKHNNSCEICPTKSFFSSPAQLSETVLEHTECWAPPVPVFTPLKNKPNSSLRMACIVEDRLFQGLRYEGELLPLTPWNWKQVLFHGKPDFLLIESFWTTVTGDWKNGNCPGTSDRQELMHIIKQAQQSGIPTVFWMTKGHEYHGYYEDFTRCADHVFCADVKEAESIRAQGIDAEELPPCVQPAIHNPYKYFKSDEFLSIDILMDYGADLYRLGMPIGVERLIRHKADINIVDSKASHYPGKVKNEHFLGCVTRTSLLTVLRYSRFFLMPQPSFMSPTHRIWEALAAAACGPLVFFDETNMDNVQLAGITLNVHDASVVPYYRELSENPLLRMKKAAIARRKIYEEHTFSHRVRSICNKLKIAHDWEEHPKISVVMPNSRPHLTRACLDTFYRQTYPNKELILLCHYPGPVDSDALGQAAENVKVHKVNADLVVGKILSFGFSVSKGEYCVRMDDDDIYGSYFLSDAMTVPRMFDVDIWGKPSGFFYSQADDAMYLRKQSNQQNCLVHSDDFMLNGVQYAGNAFFGAKHFVEKLYNEAASHANGVDTAVLKVAKDYTDFFVNMDCFDVLVWRDADLLKHQHRHTAVENSFFVCQGFDKSKVLLDSDATCSGTYLTESALRNFSIPPAEVFTKQTSTQLTIGCMVSRHTYECLSFDASCIQLDAGTWRDRFIENKPDFVLVESGFDAEIPGWKGGTAAGCDLDAMQQLLRCCTENQIPTVFWFKHEAMQAGLFKETVALFDYVYAMDAASANQLSCFLPEGKNAGLLLPAVQPKLHNPVLSERRERELDFCRECILFDNFQDVLQNKNALLPILNQLIPDGLVLVESGWAIGAGQWSSVSGLEAATKGCLSYRQLLSALKACQLYFLPFPTMYGNHSLVRKAIEALCCGCAVVTDKAFPDLNAFEMPADPLIRSERKSYVTVIKRFSGKEIAGGLGRVKKRLIFFRNILKGIRSFTKKVVPWHISSPVEELSEGLICKNLHIARRHLYLHHTYAHRLQTICRDAGIESKFQEFLKVSMITPTTRPELVDNCISRFKAQSYPNLELIFIFHFSDKHKLKASIDKIRNITGISYLALSPEMNLGACLNTAIRNADGKFWFKIDDDDEYGKNYILDMMLAQRMTDADVFGKVPKFIALDGKALYLRGKFHKGHRVPVSDLQHISGATIAARPSIVEKIPFVDNSRMGTDAVFIRMAYASPEINVLVADPYNFAVFRAKENSGHGHTWQISDKKLIQNGKYLGKYHTSVLNQVFF